MFGITTMSKSPVWLRCPEDVIGRVIGMEETVECVLEARDEIWKRQS